MKVALPPRWRRRSPRTAAKELAITGLARDWKEVPYLKKEQVLDSCLENAIDRWLEPETVDRALVTAALWEMENHWWVPVTYQQICRCGYRYVSGPIHEVMRRHKEDVLANALGLTIRPNPKEPK